MAEESDRWTAQQAQQYLMLNGGVVDGKALWNPEILFEIDTRADEHLFLMEDGIVGRGALMAAHPFGSVGQTPERVFDKLGFLCDERDETLELHTALDLMHMRDKIAENQTVIESKSLWRAGEGWSNFKNLVGTIRGFSSALALTDGNPFDRTSEDKQIRVFMKGMAKMTGLLLTDGSEADGSPPQASERTFNGPEPEFAPPSIEIQPLEPACRNGPLEIRKSSGTSPFHPLKKAEEFSDPNARSGYYVAALVIYGLRGI
jgi:hypothetical protein